VSEGWEIKKVDLEVERLITTAAIVSTDFLKEVINLWNPTYIQSDFCRTVTKWCVEYFVQYEKAPSNHIQDLYLAQKLSKSISPEISRLIADFLRGLSDRWEEEGESFNYRFVSDRCVAYFEFRAAQILQERLGACLDAGDVVQAGVAISEYKKPVKIAVPCVNVLTDKELIIAAMAEEDEDNDALFQLSGDLGRLLGTFSRDDFIAVAGPMGRGKTWALQYLATEALMANLNVIFFSMGDMTVKQMAKRFHKSFTGLPSKAGVYTFPVFDCLQNQAGRCSLDKRKGSGILLTKDGKPDFRDVPDWIPCAICRGEKRSPFRAGTWLENVELKETLTWQKAIKRGKALDRMLRGNLRLEAWPRKTAGIAEVDGTLTILQNTEGYIPDVIITDYADIMKDVSGSDEYRHQLNALWEAHDYLAKKYHALVASATQTDRSTYRGQDVGGDNVSEDIRKLAHVSVMFGLNQTAHEKREKVLRVKIIKSRHEEFDPEKECIILQQYDCGQFCTDSYCEV